MSLYDITYFIAALILVLGLMIGLAFLLKKLGIAGPAMVTPTKRRLKVVENLALDARRRLVLIERDDKQHLILLGHHGDIVIEDDIAPQKHSQDNTDIKERAA